MVILYILDSNQLSCGLSHQFINQTQHHGVSSQMKLISLIHSKSTLLTTMVKKENVVIMLTQGTFDVDLVSNGFKLLTNVGEVNEGSSGTDRYVYCAG